MKLYRHGLVVGKFSPLHRGHEFLIHRALEQSERVSILSYSKPEFEGCSAAKRTRWLRSLFPCAQPYVLDDARVEALSAGKRVLPDNEAPDDEHRDFCAWLCHELLESPCDAVFTSEEYGDGFAEHLSRAGSLRTGRESRVTHVLVDLERQSCPVSGSMLRRDIHRGRKWVSPIVYADFVDRVCFLGGESTGKSTLSAVVARICETEFVAEFGRELWELRRGALRFEDMKLIGETQVAREEEAAGRANRVLFCDTSPLTTLFYSHYLFKSADPVLEQLANRRYDRVFLCFPDFPFVQDGTRQPEEFRRLQHEWYVEELGRRGIGYHALEGALEHRISQVTRLIRLP